MCWNIMLHWHPKSEKRFWGVRVCEQNSILNSRIQRLTAIIKKNIKQFDCKFKVFVGKLNKILMINCKKR